MEYPNRENRAALLEVVGNASIIVPYSDTEITIEEIKIALEMDENYTMIEDN